MPEELAPATPVTPVQAAPEAPPAAPVENAAPEAPVSPRLEKLSKLGFENVTSEDEAFDRLLEAHVRQKEEFGEQLKAAIAELRSEQPPPVTQPQTEGRKPWKAPQVDLSTAARYRTPDGQWKPDAPAEVRAQVEALERHRSQFGEALLTDAEAAIGDMVRELARQEYEKLYGQISAKQTEEQFFDRAFSENPWLFEKDPHTGKPNTKRLSPEGQRFNALMIDAAENYGIASPIKQFEFATKMRAAEQAASQARTPTPEQAQETREQKQAALLGRAAPAASKSGSLQPGATPNSNLTPGQRLIQLARQQGMSV